MTITSRGAVAPTGDPAGQEAARGGPAGGAELAAHDVAALDAVVTLVADHAPGWAKTAAAARAELLQQVIADTMAAADGWLAAACAAKGLKPGTTEAGEELFSGVGTFVRMARLLRDALRDIARDGKPAVSRADPRGGRRATARPGLPGRGLRPHHVPADDGRGLDAARRHPRGPRPRAGGRLRRPGGARRHGPRPGRGQRRVAGPARRALQALRGGQDRRHEGEPGERLPRPALEQGDGRTDRRRRAAHRRGRRRGGPLPDRPRAHRRGAHHRLGQDLRRRGVRHGPGGRAAQGGRRARCWTSRSPPSWATSHR